MLKKFHSCFFRDIFKINLVSKKTKLKWKLFILWMASASHLFPFSYCEMLMVTMVVIVLLYGCCIVLTPESFLNLCKGINKEWWTVGFNFWWLFPIILFIILYIASKPTHCQFLMKAAVVLWCKLVVRAVQWEHM